MLATGIIKISWDSPNLISFEVVKVYNPRGWISSLNMKGTQVNGMLYRCSMRVAVF